MKNWLKAWWWILVSAVLVCGSGIIPAIIPQAVPPAYKQGSTGTKFLIATGAFTSGNLVKTDANGNAIDATIAQASVVLTNTASAYPTVTDASPIAWDLGSATVTNGIVTLDHTTATRALNLTNLVNGGFYTLVIKQDATGGALMTLGTGCVWKVVNQGAGAVVLTAAANGIDILVITYDGTNCYAGLRSNFN